MKAVSTSRAKMPTRASRLGAWKTGSIRPPIPAGELEPGELLLGEAHRERLAGRGGERDEPLLGQLAIGHEQPPLALRPTDEQVALRDVRRRPPPGRRAPPPCSGRPARTRGAARGRSTRRRDPACGVLGRHLVVLLDGQHDALRLCGRLEEDRLHLVLVEVEGRDHVDGQVDVVRRRPDEEGSGSRGRDPSAA